MTPKIIINYILQSNPMQGIVHNRLTMDQIINYLRSIITHASRRVKLHTIYDKIRGFILSIK